jgi:hypothetical protein
VNDLSGFENFPWIPPWQAISFRGRAAYEHELRLELTPGHPLYEVRTTPIGRTCHGDDILFQLHGQPAELAVVHLTFIGRPERKPQWPQVTLYKDTDHWVTRRMMPDVANFERAHYRKAA